MQKYKKVALVALVGMLMLPTAAHAEPADEVVGTLEEGLTHDAAQVTGIEITSPTPEILAAREALAELIVETAQATEAYNAALVEKEEAEEAARSALLAEYRARRKAADVEAQVIGLARSVYISGKELDETAMMLDSEGPDEVAQRVGVVETLAKNRSELLEELNRYRKEAEQARRAADRQAKRADAAEREASQRAEEIQAKTEEQTLRLQELETEQARKERFERYAQDAAAAQRSWELLKNGSAEPVGSEKVERMLDYAYAQLGKQYVWGATGPDTYDCSGLTSQAWRAAGVEIPRVSRDQYAALAPVADPDRQVGDLVFFGSPVHHVGIYVGNGMMLNAPNSTSVVRIEPLWSDYVGAGRPRM